MNKDWIDFLTLNKATFTENSDILFSSDQHNSCNTLYPLAHLACIKVSGTDATHFLQGQLTCNISDLSATNSFFAAFCNAKGRTISTLLILKTADDFLLILPTELAEKVKTKLQMYILRSDVQLTDETNKHCLLGINTDNPNVFDSLPKTNFAVTNAVETIIKFPVNNIRFLIVCTVENAKALWTRLTENNAFTITSSITWEYQDICAGIPWLTENTSEEYIPQMLNIDKLGGISFNKGCYTGQEIISRTHYLGKAKRELFVAECNSVPLSETAIQILDSENEQSVGKVLCLQSNEQYNKMLIVLPITYAESKNLVVNNSNQSKINIIDFQ